MHLYLVSHYICISFAHFSVLFMDPNIHCVDTSWALLDDTYKVLETMICHSCSNTADWPFPKVACEHKKWGNLNAKRGRHIFWSLQLILGAKSTTMKKREGMQNCSANKPTSYNAMSWHYFVKNALLSHALHLKRKAAYLIYSFWSFQLKFFSPIF